MVSESRVVFRLEPETPMLQQALRDINYGTGMEEADIATIRAALQNILDMLISALKRTSPNGSAFLSCFKSDVNWPIVLTILIRCEAIIKYCIADNSMEYLQQSLGTLRFIKGCRPRVGKKSCGILGAQAERTIWLYEAWWKAPSLRSARGIKPEKSHSARVSDALADAFMQTREGTLFHEVVHLASIGQMRRLLCLAYPQTRLPFGLWTVGDWVGDAIFHEHADPKLFVRLVNLSLKERHADMEQPESIIDAKYRRPKKGGAVEWEAAYHLDGVRDLASLKAGNVASVLNADSYNAFAAPLMNRVESSFANHENSPTVLRETPNLHPTATNRLRQAISKGADMPSNGSRDGQAGEAKKSLLGYNHLNPVAARNRSRPFSDLSEWPTPAEVGCCMIREDLQSK